VGVQMKNNGSGESAFQRPREALRERQQTAQRLHGKRTSGTHGDVQRSGSGAGSNARGRKCM